MRREEGAVGRGMMMIKGTALYREGGAGLSGEGKERSMRDQIRSSCGCEVNP